MSTSIIYHGFGIRDSIYRKTTYQEGKIIFEMVPNPNKICCPQCQARDFSLRGGYWRDFRMGTFNMKPVFLHYYIPRLECHACGAIRFHRLAFADPKRHYTWSFERYVVELCQHMCISDVAHHLRIGWHQVKEILKRNLHRRFGRPKLKHLRQLAIDEISVKKGHRYLTVVMDLETGAIVFVGHGKDAKALDPFWKRLRPSKAKIEAVAMDMSAAYRKAVSQHLPQAVIVFDHFHIIKLYNDKLSEFRRQLQQKAESEEEKKILKGTLWLLLKNSENLDDKRNERDRLKAALDLNKPLYTAYYLKEELRGFWNQSNKESARVYLDDWIQNARASGIAMLISFADTLESHYDGLLAYYDYRISTGPLEGMNNKIKTLKRQAYGFNDSEFFILRIYSLHHAKHVMVG